MAPETGSADLEALVAGECWELIRARSIGRFAVNRSGACPLVVPVNYLVEADSSIVFRSSAGAKLNAATRGHPITRARDSRHCISKQG